MGQQSNKIIKRRRRADYLKRKQENAKLGTILPKKGVKKATPKENEPEADEKSTGKKPAAKKVAKKALKKAPSKKTAKKVVSHEDPPLDNDETTSARNPPAEEA